MNHVEDMKAVVAEEATKVVVEVTQEETLK